MAHFFTADTHFSDDSVRRFFSRPFASVEKMDAAMVERAAIVGAEDDLWIVGDFAACETDRGREAAQAAFWALSGRKHLVRGNHDPDWLVQTLPWASVHDLVEIEIMGNRFVLCHYPLVTWNGARAGTIQIFGHVHTRWRGAEGRSCRECCGNCRAAGSGHVTLGPVRPQRQGTSALEAEKAFPIRRPFASGSDRKPAMPRTALERSRRRAARSGF